MLPYTPLHHLLLQGNFPALVMTSANRSDEPIAIEDAEARQRLSGIADFFLVHDRGIHIRSDDSIARVMAGRALLLRRSRGYVPRGVFLPRSQPSVLALGAELKNTVCLTQGDRAFLSQHIGDLKNPEVLASFSRSIAHLQGVLEHLSAGGGLRPAPRLLLHPLRRGTQRVSPASPCSTTTPTWRAAWRRHGVAEAAIGVDFRRHRLRRRRPPLGGEFLIGDLAGYRRAGHFRYLPMPGGDAATREPLRMALSLPAPGLRRAAAAAAAARRPSRRRSCASTCR